MSKYIIEDENGKWEIEEFDGYVTKINIEPSAKYMAEHPEEFRPKQPTAEERLAAIEDMLLMIL